MKWFGISSLYDIKQNILLNNNNIKWDPLYYVCMLDTSYFLIREREIL